LFALARDFAAALGLEGERGAITGSEEQFRGRPFEIFRPPAPEKGKKKAKRNGSAFFDASGGATSRLDESSGPPASTTPAAAGRRRLLR